jgi:hypothetical protein
MTKEEFKTKLSDNIEDSLDTALWVCDSNDCQGEPYPDGVARLVEIATSAAEPLLDYIEKLEKSEEDKINIIKDLEDKLFNAESDRTYWFDKYSLILLSTGHVWSPEWPTEEGHYWLFGVLSKHESMNRLYSVKVRLSDNGVLIYRTEGVFIHKEDGAKGQWIKAIVPSLPDPVKE